MVMIFLFCILFAQTSASFFDEFRGAMSSVENSFGKLLTDVVTDVRDTIGCTILAVKQVLALGGIFHESSEYDARCRGLNSAPTYIQETNTNYATTPPFIFTTPTVYTTPESGSGVSEKSLSDIVSQEINESIKNVNNTLFDMIEKSDAHEKMENVTNSLLQESDRLTRISSLLRHELSNISEDVKMELRKVEPDNVNPTVHDIWNNIRALHDIELNHGNSVEAIQIHHILNEVLSALRGNEYHYVGEVNTELNNERDTNSTFMEIENQFIKMEEESQDSNTIEEIAGTDLNSTNVDDELEPSDFALTFRDVALKIMDDTNKSFQFDEASENEDLITSSTERTLTTYSFTEDNIEDDPMESPEYAAIFQLPAKDSQSRKAAAEQAQKLIEQSKQTDAIMDSYFKKSSDIGTSVFDDPDFFDFGK